MNNTFKVPNVFHAGLKAVGLDPAIVPRRSGLPLNLWSSGKSMVSTEQWFDLWNAASELSGDPFIGQKIARQTPSEHFHPALIAAQHARNFRDALHRIARYKSVCCCEQMCITETKGECRPEFDWILTQERTPLALIDSSFVSLVEIGRQGNKSLRPLRVELKRKPAQQTEHETYYGCRVSFNARRDLIVFRLNDRRTPRTGEILSSSTLPRTTKWPTCSATRTRIRSSAPSANGRADARRMEVRPATPRF